MRLSNLTSALLILLTLPALRMAGQALDPPTPTCVEVLADGSTVINWIPPADPLGEFTSYDVVYSTDYFLADFGVVTGSVPTYATASYNDVAVDFNNDIGAYYLLTNSNDGSPQTSLPSDSVCGIHLNLTAVSGGGVANLFWNPPSPHTTTVTGDYQVWLEFPVGTWTQVATIPHNPDQFNQNYQHVVDDCTATYTFQIIYDHPSGCQFTSNTATEDFEDLTAPEIPEMDVVSVDPVTGLYELSWNQPAANDTWGYIVYQCVGAATVPLDTIYGVATTTWQDPAANPLTTLPANYYNVAAFDFCDFENVSPTQAFCHQPPHLLNIVWTQCTDYAEVLWTPYNGRTVDTYRIHVSENAGPFTVLAVVPGSQLTWTHENLQDGVTYEYYVEATFTSTTSTSLSNRRSQAVALAPPPAFTYLSSVDVLGEEEVEIRIHTESIPTDHLYMLERRKVNGQFWVSVDNQLSSGTNTVIFNDLDPDLKLNELEYDYRVHVLNTCGDTASTTNLGRNILLSGLANSERLVNTLSWPDYQEWDGAIDGYDIYRSTVPGVLGTLVGSVASGNNVFEDDVASELLTPGLFCYTVVARESVNSFGLTEVSSSNQLCLQMEPKIWIPNAFMVYGANPVFKPVIGFVDANSYSMQISSRWGDILFSTNDLDEGWDGTGRRGRLLPDGAYIYFIRVKDGEGLLYERVGQVFLLKAGAE